LALYILTWILSEINFINALALRKFWNFLLLITFLVSGILGLLLAILIDQQQVIDWYRKILWIHVEFGITMTIISLIHILWHIRYYINIFWKSARMNPNN
jgi:spermidine synthase